jgi:hypothetical protein
VGPRAQARGLRQGRSAEVAAVAARLLIGLLGLHDLSIRRGPDSGQPG